jgi:hypothetical protein
MSKKKSRKQETHLSPEKYIRQRSRSLPLYKCWITEKWDTEQMASIIVSRRHVSGNLTFCMYLVDLMCLGVKNTMYAYNDSGVALKQMFKNFADRGNNFMEIDYATVHNIIYAALEYAEEYGFMPHTDFTNITQYFLEEDNENIPIIEIHCGDENGKPMFVETGHEDPVSLKMIIAKLQKTAGEGNFRVCLKDDVYKYETVENYLAICDEIKSKFSAYSNEYLIDMFVKLNDKNTDNMSINVLMMNVVEVLSNRIIDANRVFEYIDMFKSLFDIEIVDMKNFPNSFFVGFQDDHDKLFDAYTAVYNEIKSDNFKPQLEKLRNITGDIPIIYYLELIRQAHEDYSKYFDVLKKCYQKYPDYFVFKILWNAHLYVKYQDKKAENTLSNIISDTAGPITEYEMFEYFRYYASSCLLSDDSTLEKIVAFEKTVKSMISNTGYTAIISAISLTPKIILLKKHINSNVESSVSI